MANVNILDGNGDTRYLKAAGAGTSGDPYVPEQSMSQASHDNLNVNANMQIGDTDAGMANPVPVKFGTNISLPAGTNNIGDVDLASPVPAGELHIGQVSEHAAIVDVALSLDTAAYADGDVLADTQAAASAARVNAGIIRLRSLTVLDEDDQGAAMDILFLDANASIGTENAAVSVTDANARNILGLVRIVAGDWIDLGGCRLATKTDLNLMLKAASGVTTLYVAAISRGTGTYTASGVRLRIGLEQF